MNGEFAGPYELWVLMSYLVSEGGNFTFVPGGWRASIGSCWFEGVDFSPDTLREAWSDLRQQEREARRKVGSTPSATVNGQPATMTYPPPEGPKVYLSTCMYQVGAEGETCSKCGRPHNQSAREAFESMPGLP